jgi:hypothetical protein
MTAEEMKYEFLVGFDLITKQGGAGVENEELSVIFTTAQENVIMAKYDGTRDGISYEATEKRKKELSKIILAKSLAPSLYQIGVHRNGVFFDLPFRTGEECFLVIEENCIITPDDSNCIEHDNTEYSETGKLTIEVKPIPHDFYIANINNPYRQPYIKQAWRMDGQKNPNTTAKLHELISDGTYEFDTYNIWYIKKPRPIIISKANSTKTIDGYPCTTSLDCELDTIVHRDIVDEAIRIASRQTREYQQYNVQNLETQINK